MTKKKAKPDEAGASAIVEIEEELIRLRGRVDELTAQAAAKDAEIARLTEQLDWRDRQPKRPR